MVPPMLYFSSSYSNMGDTLMDFWNPEKHECDREPRWDFKKYYKSFNYYYKIFINAK